jgi:WD40 repeat protein
MALSANGKLAISGSMDGTLKVWDVESGYALRTLERHCGCITGVAVTRDWKRAVSASSDRTLKVWDLESGHTVSVAIRPDGKRAASASRDRTLKLWNLESGVCIATIHCDAEVLWCAFAQQTVIASDNVGRVHFFRLEEWLPPSMPVRLVILPFRTRLHPRCHFSKIFFL